VIASLQGQLAATRENAVILNVNGVGFLVRVTQSLMDELPPIGHALKLFTHMAVRENDISLYGFSTLRELDLFVILIGVNGIGPRTALSTLSAFSPEVLQSAVAQGDAVALTRIPGIGRKTAQRLVLDLKDRIGIPADSVMPAFVSGNTEVVNALTALGYSIAEAQGALGAIPEDAQELDERILAALRHLGGG